MIKRFLEWIQIKEIVHNSGHIPPLFKEGELWWCHLGENVGIEINGKGDRFTRPIFILRKYDRQSFLGLPLTTKPKNGSWYISVIFGGETQTINLVQGRVFDYRRLKEKICELDGYKVEKIREAYLLLHTTSPKIDLPPSLAGVVGKSQTC